MAEPLKNLYSTPFINRLSNSLENCISNFDKQKFVQLVLNKDWMQKELKQRMNHISFSIHQFLSNNYVKDIKTILKINSYVQKENYPENSFVFMFLPDYIEKYGLDNFELSMQAMEKITQFVSCEFAIRPFIPLYEKQVLTQMLAWSKHPHQNVRRFASEGIRPLLPWGLAAPNLKKSPEKVLPILENLKSDTSEFVRKSVANNLNDISKLKPQLVIAIAQKWKGKTPQTDAIIKHACRTLFKKGNNEILSLYNLNSKDVEVEAFKINTSKVRQGDYCEFEFCIKNKAKKTLSLRIEYAVYYLLKNNTHAKKVFKISEKEIEAKAILKLNRKQSFKPITTRTYYKGEHKISIIINGKEFEIKEFMLL